MLSVKISNIQHLPGWPFNAAAVVVLLLLARGCWELPGIAHGTVNELCLHVPGLSWLL